MKQFSTAGAKRKELLFEFIIGNGIYLLLWYSMTSEGRHGASQDETQHTGRKLQLCQSPTGFAGPWRSRPARRGACTLRRAKAAGLEAERQSRWPKPRHFDLLRARACLLCRPAHPPVDFHPSGIVRAAVPPKSRPDFARDRPSPAMRATATSCRTRLLPSHCPTKSRAGVPRNAE